MIWLCLWLAGMVALLLVEAQPHAGEFAALLAWPITFPLSMTLRAFRRWRTTCRACRLRWSDHDALLRHKSAAGH